jgi:tetratricopeptide (TPR) repeat protein
MHLPQVCIVARLMRSTSDRALRLLGLVTLLVATLSTLGCEQLDGRNRNKKGNRYFREMKFIDAVAEYEKALKTVKEPTIHYNVALAYSKIFKPGMETDADLLLGEKGSFVCDQIPQVKFLSKQVCVKPGDRRYDPCDAKNVCASSFTCKQTELCAISNNAIADMTAQHFGLWIKAHPNDVETRGLMTQVWIDSSQYKKAIDYWEDLLKAKPNDPDIMGSLAGINLKAGDWRKSIEWYTKVAEAVKEQAAATRAKLATASGDEKKKLEAKATAQEANIVAAYGFIGNVAWSKLNSKTLTTVDSVELADRGIGALQKAAEMQPKNPKHFGLMGSIFNFRSLAQGASWAAGLDRATAQDLQIVSRVLSDEAKKAQGLLPVTPAPAPPAQPAGATAPPNTPNPAQAPGGPAKTGG